METVLTGNSSVFQIVSGLRTDDIAASAILHKFVQVSGRPAAFPFFIARTVSPASCPHLFRASLGFRRVTVGVSLDATLFSQLDKENIPFPVYWDNQGDSLRYRGLPGCSVTSGESICAAVVSRLEKNIVSGYLSDWMDKDMFRMFISKYTDILELIASSMNLQTFLRDTKSGSRINAIPYIYSPAQIFMALTCSPEKFFEMLESKAVTLYLEDSAERIERAGGLIIPSQISDRYRIGCITGGSLWESDYENACASYLRYSADADPGKHDAIALVVWDPFVSGQVSQIRLRTLRSEAGAVAEEMESILGRRNIRIERESKNRVNVHIRHLKDRFAGREKIVNRLIVPSVQRAYAKRMEEANGASFIGEAAGYKQTELKYSEKAEKIKKAKEKAPTEPISGGLRECLETAKQDRSADF
ncbi:MAG: hypothetical protein EOM51_10910 [Clostridia bacterium]|nr:hypothetical protein [Clostridia bacterium]